MSQTLASKREILHRVKCDGKTLELALGYVDEQLALAQSLIPFDDPTGWQDWITKSVKDGTLFSGSLNYCGETLGLMTWCFDQHKEREMLVASASVENSKGFDFTEIVTLFAVKIAQQSNAKYVRFHTVRKGLIFKAIKLGYEVSEIVMRLKVPQNVQRK